MNDEISWALFKTADAHVMNKFDEAFPFEMKELSITFYISHIVW